MMRSRKALKRIGSSAPRRASELPVLQLRHPGFPTPDSTTRVLLLLVPPDSAAARHRDSQLLCGADIAAVLHIHPLPSPRPSLCFRLSMELVNR
jgi:hypothetical protein